MHSLALTLWHAVEFSRYGCALTNEINFHLLGQPPNLLKEMHANKSRVFTRYTIDGRSLFKISFLVSHPLRSTSDQGWPNCALVYPVFGALPLTGKVSRSAVAKPLFGSAECAEIGAIPATKPAITIATRISQRDISLSLCAFAG